MTCTAVATREGGVDRNTAPAGQTITIGVATREGGVDRNTVRNGSSVSFAAVATREGGVDRNSLPQIWPRISSSRHPRGWRG